LSFRPPSFFILSSSFFILHFRSSTFISVQVPFMRIIAVSGLAVLVLAAGNAFSQQPAAEAELNAAFNKAIALRKAGKTNEAISLLTKALDLAPKAFGPDHLNTAAIANTLGATCLNAGQFAEAAKAFRLSLEIREKRLGPKHEQVASSLGNLAVAYQELSRFEDAEAAHARALAIREAILPANHPDLALSLNNFAALYEAMAAYPKAIALLERSLKIQESSGKEHGGVAYVANNLGVLYHLVGRFDEAEVLVRRALRIREQAKDPLEVATCLRSLAQVCAGMGRIKDAEAAVRRALAIREAQLGKSHFSLAGLLNIYGGLMRDTGKFSESEAAYRRCAEIAEAAYGKDHPHVATALANLALLYSGLGRTEETEQLLRRAIQINETTLGRDHPSVASNLNNLAAFYAEHGRLQEAEALYRRCLAIGEARHGIDQLEVAAFSGNLGSVCWKLDRLEEAEKHIRRSLHILELRLGEKNPRTAPALNSLGLLYWHMGRLEEAAVFLKRCVDLVEPHQDENPAVLASALNNLASLYQGLGRKREAWQLAERSLRLQQAGLRQVFAFSSEAAMHSYLDTMSGVLPDVINRASQADADGPTPDGALSWVLRLKGVALDTLCRYRQAQHRLLPDDPLAARVSKYQSLKQMLANAAVNPPDGLAPDQLAKQMAQWRKQAEALESELNRAVGAKQAAEDVDAALVRQRLGQDAALVELIRAPMRDFKRPGRWLEEHYFAFVLAGGTARARLIDLGPAKALDTAVGELRQEVGDFQNKLRDVESGGEALALEKAAEKRFVKISAALYQRLMAPLQEAVGSAHLLYLAPDAALNRLPFEALVDEKGKYLIESRRCAYLSSGRDLLQPKMLPARGTVVFAGPDYKLAADERQARAEKLLAKNEVVALAATRSATLRSVGWKALPGAAAEARDIEKNLRGSPYAPVRTFVGADALEEVLKALPAPRVLHLATHGFFLDHEPASPAAADDGPGAGAGWARGRLRQIDNPLLRSGIVLAGANTVGNKDSTARAEDGWVTAEEIALLNLSGTELVVLSACQTGLGDVKSGEGVFGLRRAFLFAGARTLVTSLFEVPDQDTRELMQRFYSNLKSGQGKLAALNAAQRELLQRRRQAGAAHPFFWASFVMVGDPE
jgi:CHAT domain-containing protein